MADIDDEPDDDVFHALLWGRLHVRGAGQKWVTEWKVLKAAWVRTVDSGMTMGRVPWSRVRSAKRSEHWRVPNDTPTQIERVEATHWMPLPEGPKNPLDAAAGRLYEKCQDQELRLG